MRLGDLTQGDLFSMQQALLDRKRVV